MTGLVRKATLLGVCGLFAAASAWAFVPDPSRSTCTTWLYISGKPTTKIPGQYECDTDGLYTVTVKIGRAHV